MPEAGVAEPARARAARARRLLSRLAPLAPWLVGLAAFRVVAGTRLLSPTNIGWIRGEDQAQHYLGWAFFRQGPWTWPLAANPDWGLEFSNSVLFSDSIPLLALLFKPWASLLPHPFQYLGLWVGLCFVLQSWIAWKIAGRLGAGPWVRLLAAGFFVFAPPMLLRLAGHWALVGHWIVLGALYLWLTPGQPRRPLWWSLLGAVAVLTHMYLFLLVALVWATAWLTAAGWRLRPWRALLLEAVAVPATMVLALWQAGFFLVGEGKTGGGYGRFGLNLNSLVNPAGWSYLLPSLGTGEGSYEGFAYLGLGGLFLAGSALVAAWRLRAGGGWRPSGRWAPMAALFAALTLFAVSNHVAVGAGEHVVEVPAFVLAAGNMARASGRLFWPVYYAILIGSLALVLRGFRRRTAGALVAAAFLLQAADTSAGWRHVNPSLGWRSRNWPTPLTHAFWQDVPALYRRIRLIQPRNGSVHWKVLSDYAQRHGLATDAAFLARVDRARYLSLYERTERILKTGGFEADSLYVFEGGQARRAPCVIDPRADLLAIVDGMWVLAPGWKARFGDRFSGLTQLPCPGGGGEAASFGTDGAGLAMLGEGWAPPESWGSWNEGERSALNLHVFPGAGVLELEVDGFVPPGAPPLAVTVSIDGARVDTWSFEAGQPTGWRRVRLPDVGREPRRVRVGFAYSALRAPSEWGPSPDSRRLALGVRQARVVRGEIP